MRNLERKDIKILFLEGCNSGHFDYCNIAQVFSRKVKGFVVASDGTVRTYPEKDMMTYESISDITFRGWLPAGVFRTNYGWIKYYASAYFKKLGLTERTSLKRILCFAGG